MKNKIQQIIEDFQFLDSWEDKYSYLIDLGEITPEFPFPEEGKIPENKVQGCVSNAYMKSWESNEKFYFSATSDAKITQGLIAILQISYCGIPKKEIQEVPIHEILQKIELESHLSPQRSNGLHSMIQKILSHE